jgi:hypothetical protein
MVRKLAVAAAVIGACAFISPSFGKGGFSGGFHAAPAPATGLAPNFARPAPTMQARPPLYTGMAPNFVEKRGLHRHHFRFVDRRHHRRALGLGVAAAVIAAPVIYAVPDYAEPAPGAVALWRGNSSGVCDVQSVQVRGDRGMDEVNVIRC